MDSSEKASGPRPVILLVATFDTKAEEAFYLKNKIESLGCGVLTLDAGILGDSPCATDISRYEVARAGGSTIEELVASGDKGLCIETMRRGATRVAAERFAAGAFKGVIAVGGGQGTDIGTAVMRELPFGVPKFMISTVASGRATFGTFVGTKDIVIMHSVADVQGINFITKRVFDNAAAAICGMVRDTADTVPERGTSVALSMLGTVTPGAMRAKKLLRDRGYEAVAFHQNGTGGIAMEDLIREGVFKGVLDLNLHELGDAVAGGLHAAVRDYRLLAAGEMGIPQVVVPGSINYGVWGPLETLPPEFLQRKYIVHNSYLTLVRLSHKELEKTALIVAERLNRAKGPLHVFIPLRGFSYPDCEGRGHWEPEGNAVFITTLRRHLSPAIPYDEIDMHINDAGFIDIIVDELVRLMEKPR